MIPEYPPTRDSSHSDTDPDTLLEDTPVQRQLIQNAGVSILQVCPVCDCQAESGMALYQHLHSLHPNDKPYPCDKCGVAFNNIKEHSSHCSNIHHPKRVSCKQCDYVATSKAKMWQHIRQHTMGIACSKCDKSFPTLSEVIWHE